MQSLVHVLLGDRDSRGWYDNPQPVLKPVFIAAQCATPYVQNVCMHR